MAKMWFVSFDDESSMELYRIGCPTKRISGTKSQEIETVEALERAVKEAHEARPFRRPFLMFKKGQGREPLFSVDEAKAYLKGADRISARIYKSGAQAIAKQGQIDKDIPITSQRDAKRVEALVQEYRNGDYNHATARYFRGDSAEPLSNLQVWLALRNLPSS